MPIRILIVEDESIVALDIKNRLTDLGYRVMGVADTGDAAIQLAGRQRPDLVLMDIQLLGPMDGVEAAIRIHRQHRLPVVFLTAYGEESILERAQQAEPVGYLLKPFDDRTLKATIEMGLGRQRMEEEIRRLSRLYATLSQVNQAITRIRQRDELFAEICRVTVVFGQFRTAWIGWQNDPAGGLRPIARYEEGGAGVSTTCAWQCDSAHHALREGKPHVRNHLESGAESGRCLPLSAPLEIHACGSFPIRFQGRIGGVLSVCAAEADFFQEAEVKLLEEVAIDISYALDYQESERRHLQAEEALRQSEERFRSMVEVTSDWVWEVDQEGVYTYASPKVQTLLGYRPEEVVGRKPFDFMPTDEAQRVHAEFSRHAARGQPFSYLENINVSKDGRRVVLESSGVPIFDPAGQLLGYRGMDRDITEKKQLENQYFRAQRLESIGQLAAGISHDLNNILAPLLMATPLVREEVRSPEAHALLDTIEASAQRGADIIKQLLVFSRGEKSQKLPLSLLRLAKEMHQIMRETFPKSLSLRTQLPSHLWMVEGDRTQLHQVLLNLCVNARDAMPDGGILTLAAENVVLDEQSSSGILDAKPGRYVLLRVSDTGVGIPPESLDRIFDPFFTTKTIDKGTGLGLATVLGIVKNHEGFIQVQSAINQGSHFEVYLPAMASSESPATAMETASPPPGQGQLVLLIDDEESICRVSGRLLERSGYRVLIASNGAEGVQLYAAHRDAIALVVTDMMMPAMDGTAAIQALRQINPQIKIIAVSGVQQGTPPLDLQVNAFLQKPFTAETLLKALHTLLIGG